MNVLDKNRFGAVCYLPGPRQGRYPYCHSVYVAGSGVLIDPAADRATLEYIRDHHGVSQIWLTHVHEDHIAHLDLFEDVPVFVHPAEEKPLSNIEAFLDNYDVDPDSRDFWRRILEEKFHFKPRRPDGLLREGQVVELDEVSVQVLHTPGHTPGHLAFLFREPGVLLLGDYDLTPFGPWYGDTYSDIDQTIASVRRLRAVRARVWIASHEHGLFTEQPGGLWDDYLAVVDRREAGLLALLKKGCARQDIVDARLVYGKAKEPKEFFDLNEWAIMKKHLDRLIWSGRAVEKNGLYRLA